MTSFAARRGFNRVRCNAELEQSQRRCVAATDYTCFQKGVDEMAFEKRQDDMFNVWFANDANVGTWISVQPDMEHVKLAEAEANIYRAAYEGGAVMETKAYTLTELIELSVQYLETKDASEKDELYTTDYGFHAIGVDGFLEWLEQQEPSPC
jgi:hypothetical protein